jgi:predicted nucleotide-binding protein (sugar kinase/HSP70/actin superfamily)
VWGPRLGITEDESDWAVEQGFAALGEFDRLLQEKGKAILEQVEREDRVAILVISRPYHNDPGLNHGIPDEFQVLGYPILSMRSVPKDPAWLKRFFGEADPLNINDVWAENYSANSVQKVWAARFAARHPNVAVLDLSSFKCGHDAPTYGIVDKIISTARTPYSALHDIDANKPGGSIQIRVKTYSHKLKLVEEALRDQSVARAELARRVADERRRLIAELRGAHATAPAAR